MEAVVSRERPASYPQQRIVPLGKDKHDRELSNCEKTSSVSKVAGGLQRIGWVPEGRVSTVQMWSKIKAAIPEVPFKKIIAGKQEDDAHDQVHDQEDGFDSGRDGAEACRVLTMPTERHREEQSSPNPETDTACFRPITTCRVASGGQQLRATMEQPNDDCEAPETVHRPT